MKRMSRQGWLIGLFAFVGILPAAAQTSSIEPSVFAKMREERGPPITGTPKQPLGISTIELQELGLDLPVAQLAKIAQLPAAEIVAQTRSARDAQIYKVVSPSVVIVATKGGLGSGSLLSTSGHVLTNWHVVRGYPKVAVVFKPIVEGATPGSDDIKLGRVVKYDEVSDLALIDVSEVPAGRRPIALGDSQDINIGADVHAIGHPTGEAWTYTKGIISQYRVGYEWTARGEDIKHKADIIQTQTPINPGNSGGPLISDKGTLIGVNSFKGTGEGLNYAVSLDEVKRFLARRGSRNALRSVAKGSKSDCEAKETSRFRSKNNDATIITYSSTCNRFGSAEYIIPDNTSKSILLKLDRNGDGKADVVFFDFKRRGKWDLSFWDEGYSGRWTLVGYHDDGSVTPSRFESYEAYRRRMASR